MRIPIVEVEYMTGSSFVHQKNVKLNFPTDVFEIKDINKAIKTIDTMADELSWNNFSWNNYY